MSDEQDILKALGARIKQIREGKGLSQMAVAYESEMSLSHFSKIENGHHGPGVWVLVKIARAMKVKPSEIITALDRFIE